jgi:hypothetical protein
MRAYLPYAWTPIECAYVFVANAAGYREDACS